MAVPNTERGGRRDEGFTLVEMMVALIVLSVLVAIALPTFLNARERASDKAAQTKLTTALKAHKAHIASKRVADYYDDISDARSRLEEMEPSVAFKVPSEPEVKGAVYVRDADGNVVMLVARSRTSSTCFWTREEAGTITYAQSHCSEAGTAAPPADAEFRDDW